jgi:RND superfamily putative drug exporter
MLTSRPDHPPVTPPPGAPPPGGDSLLGRLGGWCFDHRRATVGLWAAVLVVVLGVAGAVGPAFGSGSVVPNSDSATGFAVLEEHFPELGTGGQSGMIVFRAEQGVDDPEVADAMERLFATVDAGFPDEAGRSTAPGATVVSPYSAQGGGQIASAGPLAGELAFAQVTCRPTSTTPSRAGSAS